jgi:hypothetical protein
VKHAKKPQLQAGHPAPTLPHQIHALEEVPIDFREADRLRAKAASLRARAAKLVEEAAALRKEAEAFETAAGVLQAATGTHGHARVKILGLKPKRDDSTVESMDVDTRDQAESVRRGAGRAKRKHEAQKRLYECGHTITSLAQELREGRSRVSSWFAVGEANRPIPRRYAELLRDKYEIPLTVWARIAD